MKRLQNTRICKIIISVKVKFAVYLVLYFEVVVDREHNFRGYLGHSVTVFIISLVGQNFGDGVTHMRLLIRSSVNSLEFDGVLPVLWDFKLHQNPNRFT